MLTDLERLQQLLNPSDAFLITRDQLEDARKIVAELIRELAWKSTEKEWPDEISSVIVLVDGKAVPGFWQENQEGDWETGYRPYRQWFYINEDGDFRPIEYDSHKIVLWKPFPSLPKKENANVPTT